MNGDAIKNSTNSKAQEICIDLPGETVQCWRSTDRLKVVLRKHRDVIFEINMVDRKEYTIESASNFYSPRDKKILRKCAFANGEKFHIWVARNHKGNLVLKSGSTVIGVYDTKKLDLNKYSEDPKIKPEPLMIIMGKQNLPSSFICTPEDPYAISESEKLFQPDFDKKLQSLSMYGTEFSYSYSPHPIDMREYIAVATAMPGEIKENYLKQLDSGQEVEGSVTQLFKLPGKDANESGIYDPLSKTVAFLSSNWLTSSSTFKETVGYLIANWKSLDKLSMTVHIKKTKIGKYRVALKGVPLGKLVSHMLGGARSTLRHETFPLGSKKGAFLDGGYERTGRRGYGGFKRILITTTENFKDGLKIQAAGTILDIFDDANDVYVDEKGSDDFSEFLARVGITLIKGAIAAAVGSVIAALIMGALAASGVVIPVFVGSMIVLAGYIAVATLIDKIDERFKIKDTVGALAR